MIRPEIKSRVEELRYQLINGMDEISEATDAPAASEEDKIVAEAIGYMEATAEALDRLMQYLG